MWSRVNPWTCRLVRLKRRISSTGAILVSSRPSSRGMFFSLGQRQLTTNQTPGGHSKPTAPPRTPWLQQFPVADVPSAAAFAAAPAAAVSAAVSAATPAAPPARAVRERVREIGPRGDGFWRKSLLLGLQRPCLALLEEYFFCYFQTFFSSCRRSEASETRHRHPVRAGGAGGGGRGEAVAQAAECGWGGGVTWSKGDAFFSDKDSRYSHQL